MLKIGVFPKNCLKTAWFWRNRGGVKGPCLDPLLIPNTNGYIPSLIFPVWQWPLSSHSLPHAAGCHCTVNEHWFTHLFGTTHKGCAVYFPLTKQICTKTTSAFSSDDIFRLVLNDTQGWNGGAKWIQKVTFLPALLQTGNSKPVPSKCFFHLWRQVPNVFRFLLVGLKIHCLNTNNIKEQWFFDFYNTPYQLSYPETYIHPRYYVHLTKNG